MARARRGEPRIRLLVASALAGGPAMLLIAALASGHLVGEAGVVAVIGAGCAVWVMDGEVRRSRTSAAEARAEQARRFLASWTETQQSQREFASSVAELVRRQDERIDVLCGQLRAAQRRCDEAEARLRRERRRGDEAEARLQLESQRVRQAQERLAAVLDEVFGTSLADADEERPANRRRTPPVIHLREWEPRLHA